MEQEMKQFEDYRGITEVLESHPLRNEILALLAGWATGYPENARIISSEGNSVTPVMRSGDIR
jgi:hypothetical protein